MTKEIWCYDMTPDLCIAARFNQYASNLGAVRGRIAEEKTNRKLIPRYLVHSRGANKNKKMAGLWLKEVKLGKAE